MNLPREIAVVADSVCAVLLFVAGGLILWQGSDGSNVMSLGDWLRLPGSVDTVIRPVLQLDATSAVLLLVAASLVPLRTPGSLSSSAFTGRLAIVALSAGAVMTTDLVLLIILWSLLGVVLTGTCHESSVGGGCSAGPQQPQSPWLILYCSSACLLAALLVGISRYHTTDLLQLAAMARADERIDAAQVGAGLTVCLAGAAAIRCALFPGILWLRRCFQSSAPARIDNVLLATLLPGLAIVVRLSAFPVNISDGVVLLAGLGALTGVVAAVIACTTTNSAATFSLLSVCVVASGCATGITSGDVLGGIHSPIFLRTILAQLPLLAVVFSLVTGPMANAAYRSRPVTPANLALGGSLAVLISGLAGTNASLLGVQFLAFSDFEPWPASLPAQRLCLFVWTACVIGQGLFAFALVRTVLLLRKQKSADESEPGWGSASAWIPAILTLAAVAAAGGVPIDANQMDTRWFSGFIRFSVASMFTPGDFWIGAAAPASIVGAVAAWFMFRPAASSQSQTVPRLESISRLGRNWFYLDQIWRVVVVIPTRVMSLIVEGVDRHLLSSGREEAWRFSAASLADGIDDIRRSGSVYYGLGIILMIAGIVFVLR